MLCKGIMYVKVLCKYCVKADKSLFKVTKKRYSIMKEYL